MVKTRIICTLGPSSGNETIIRKMVLAGMDVARLNLSHGSTRLHQEKIEIIRRVNRRYRRAIKILLDLEGLRIRIGILQEHKPIELKRRQIFYLKQGKIIGEGNLASFNYNGPIGDIKKGQHIFIDDGNISLKVLAVRAKTVKTEVVVAGLLKENKGINIPEAHLKFFGLSRKDRDGIHFGIRERVDYIAQSFVRNKKDILNVVNIVKKNLPECKVIAKIENREGIRNIEEIIEHCDGIMIARGDMGVSLPIYEIPILQKQIIKKCNQRKKMVITATQMLESMVNNPRPTRAEVTDVANAILDGTDFVMLSEETAAGKFPVEAVTMMNQVIKFTEDSAIYQRKK